MPLHTPTLTNDTVTLKPTTLDHAPGLFRACEPDDETFRYFSRIPSPWNEAGMREYAEKLLHTERTVSYTVFDNSTDTIVGQTSYCDIRESNRGVEIGWTWYAPSARGTTINPATKLLLLTHAFSGDLFGVPTIRVQLKTDERNTRSRRGIEKLGAAFEGILRDHVIMPDGHFRQSAMYSITATEWPEIERGLVKRLER